MGLLLNRAKANTATTGTGAVTPSTAVSPFQTWSAAGATSGYWYDYLIEDGANWEMGVGFYNGTTITRPGPGVDPWFTSSTGSLLSLTGSATIACVANKDTLAAGAPFMPPLASSFSLQSGDATNLTLTNNTTAGLQVDPGAPVAGDESRIAYRTLTDKTLDWVMVAHINCIEVTTNYSAFGLYAYDSVANRASAMHVQSISPFVCVNNYTGLTTYSATAGSIANQSTATPTWFRIRQVSSTLFFDMSQDGVMWTNIYSVATTTWLTSRPDRVGLGVMYNRTTGPRNFLSVPYFSLTGAGV